MKNSDYWRKRFQQLEETQYLQGEEYCKILKEQFQTAANNIQADIEKWYYRLAENNSISYLAAKKLLTKRQLKEFKWTLEEYIKYGQENALNQKWVKELENASAKYHISYLEAMKLQIQQEAEKLFMEYENGSAGLLGKVYTDSFYHSAYEIAKGTGVGTNFHALNARQIDKVLKKQWAVDGANYSDRIWRNKEKLLNALNTELTQNIIRGNSFYDISQRIAKQMDTGMNQAMRLIQTEEAAIAASGQEDCYMELGIEEFEVIETLDSRTCEFCAYMDRKHFPMTEYKIGITVPPFHPYCRGCTCPYFNDDFTSHEKRIARGEDGRNYYVSGNMTYKEWKTNYVDKGLAANDEKFYNIPEHDKPVKLGQVDFSNKDMILLEIMKHEKVIVDDQIENAVVVKKDGTVMQCFGTLTGVYPDADLGAGLSGAYVTHNHPDGSNNEYSFSNADIQLFINSNLSVLRGIDSRYIYELTRNAEDVDEYMTIAELMSSEDDNARHENVISIARQYGIGYRRWRR